MNQGPNATTPTTTEAKIHRENRIISINFGARAYNFEAAGKIEAENAVLALNLALEAGRAQGRAEAANARAKPNPALVCILEDEPGRLTLETSRGVAEEKPKSLAAAQDTIAALRADVERLSAERDAHARGLEETRLVNTRLRRERDDNRSGLQAWERRARDAETAVDLIRAELGVHPTRTPKEVLDEMRERLAAGPAEDVNETWAAAEAALLKRIINSDDFDPDNTLALARAFAALRGAE